MLSDQTLASGETRPVVSRCLWLCRKDLAPHNMRILMIGPFAWAPKGTVSARAFLIARALAEKGHQVRILMCPYDNPSNAGYEWEQDGVQLKNMYMPSWGDSLSARLTAPLALARNTIRFRPDLVHVFKPVGYGALAGIYLRIAQPGLPLILDCDDWEGRGGWADVNPYPRLWRWFFACQEAWLVRRADAVTVASRALQTHIWGLGVRQERVFYFPNGPNTFFREHRHVAQKQQNELRSALGIGDARLALYSGYISYGSEVDLVVEALPRVLKAVPDLIVVFNGAGNGIPQLVRRAEQAGVAPQVVCTGWVNLHRTAVYLAISNLALYPHRDSLINRAKSPCKITTYMAMGRPIVATAVGEAVNYLDGGRAGMLVEPDDPQAFAEGMIALLRCPNRAAELGRQAERRIWECYDWAVQVVELEKAYRAVIQHRF
jgi:glycosyltransferase involved in cell wall biosynthesis